VYGVKTDPRKAAAAEGAAAAVLGGEEKGTDLSAAGIRGTPTFPSHLEFVLWRPFR